jgi:hypothetical protein
MRSVSAGCSFAPLRLLEIGLELVAYAEALEGTMMHLLGVEWNLGPGGEIFQRFRRVIERSPNSELPNYEK